MSETLKRAYAEILENARRQWAAEIARALEVSPRVREAVRRIPKETP